MLHEPTLMTGPALIPALEALLGPPGERPVGVLGSVRVARRLSSLGHAVIVLGTSEAKRAAKALGKESEPVPGSGEAPSWAVKAGPESLPLKPGQLGALIAVGVFGGRVVRDAQTTVKGWVRAVAPSGVVALAELGAEGSVGRLFLKVSRWLRRRTLELEPPDLCRLLLCSGAGRVSQVWPQGLGSWVLTHGRVSPLVQWQPQE